MRPLVVVPALVSLLLLAGCGGSGDAPASEPAASASPSPDVEADASYDTAEDLRDAAVGAGYDCPAWKEVIRNTGASSAGSCSEADLFSVYDEELDVTEQKAQWQRNDELLDGEAKPWLIGPNWIINSAGAPQLQRLLGGTLAGA